MSTAPSIVTEQLDAVRRLCRKHHVARLELFGSATSSRFDFEHSDLDFLVDLAQLPPTERADAYFGLLAGLQDLFQRDIDLVEVQAIHNPYLEQAIEAGRTVLYAA
jgi:predicted nucleotidyltransferase